MYDDGLARFSVFLEPLNGATVTDTRTQLGPTVAVSRRVTTPQGEMMVTVVGEIPVGTAERIKSPGDHTIAEFTDPVIEYKTVAAAGQYCATCNGTHLSPSSQDGSWTIDSTKNTITQKRIDIKDHCWTSKNILVKIKSQMAEHGLIRLPRTMSEL